MKIICFLFLIMALFQISCSINKVKGIERLAPTKIILESIECINLSENMSRLSTHEDEVLIKIDVLQNRGSNCKILDKVRTEVNVFTKKNAVYELNEVVEINEAVDEIVVSLIELDESGNEDRIVEISDSLLLECTFLNDEIDFVEIDSLFGYDDFLGIAQIKMQHEFSNDSNVQTIKGMQLFDRFEYTINYRLQ